jgi:hypothetical protein
MAKDDVEEMGSTAKKSRRRNPFAAAFEKPGAGVRYEMPSDRSVG